MRKDLDEIFNRLDRWRHFPNYQLERRGDIFFSLYLVDFLGKQCKPPLQDIVIPEFPIKRDLVSDVPSTRKSVKVDYVLFAKDHSLVLFVELKTDISSRREDQDSYLEISASKPFAEILEGVKEISIYTRHKQKYFHLLSALGEAGFLNLPSDLDTLLFPTVKSGVRAALERIEVLTHEPEITVFYLQPESEDGASSTIGFGDFADFVGKYDDELSKKFAESLRDWISEAGSTRPLSGDSAA